MPIVGFGFDKVSVEKKQPFSKDDRINNSMRISEVRETKLKTSDKNEEEALTVLFEFSLDYEKAGDLELKGHILFYDSKDKIKELYDFWNKNKRLPTEFSTFMFNFIMFKSSVKALALEEEVGLPLHLRLPKFKVEKQQKAAS